MGGLVENLLEGTKVLYLEAHADVWALGVWPEISMAMTLVLGGLAWG